MIHAERRFAEETQKQKRLGQLMARRYGSTQNLELQRLDVEQAQKELLRARTRLELQKKTGATKGG
ncbi:MAG: hypothetical protein CMJ64_25275 [Planctomycetaceae bacterium]|nr:hypothetical protein [Planctomycetaceae bacterium]